MTRARSVPGFRIVVWLWAVPASLTVLQMYTSAYVNRAATPPPGAIVPAALEWLIWAPLTPAVIALNRRYPLFGPLQWRTVAVHLAAIGSASALRGSVYLGATAVFVNPIPADQLGPYFQRIALGWLPIAAVVYGAILGFGSAVEFALQSRRAELNALRAHLHPHFLFNSLHAVSALVRAGERATAVRVIAELSGLLRESLRRDGPDEVPLQDEVDFTRRYLDIVTLRFQDRMTVDWRIDPAVAMARVPRMVLQPLVENAIRHGIAVRGDAGRVEIDASQVAGTLRLRVADDGPGLGPASGASSAGSGSGLAGIRARVRHLHGEAATLSLVPAVPRGAVATLTLPLRMFPR